MDTLDKLAAGLCSIRASSAVIFRRRGGDRDRTGDRGHAGRVEASGPVLAEAEADGEEGVRRAAQRSGRTDFFFGGGLQSGKRQLLAGKKVSEEKALRRCVLPEQLPLVITA